MADHWSDRLPRMMQVCLFWVALALVLALAPVWRLYRWLRSQYASIGESDED